MTARNFEHIVEVVYEVNRAYAQSLGDFSFKPWAEADDWQKSTIRQGIAFVIQNPQAGPGDSHQSWLDVKTEEGWRYGPVKDVEAKTHPCYVPYDDLPAEQRAKDYIFLAVVKTCLNQMYEADVNDTIRSDIRQNSTPRPVSEAEVEQAIQAAGKTAPRLTPADIDATIASEDYYVFPGTTMTVCCLTLRNGFNSIGYSAAASPENFDAQIGRDISRRNAREKIWALEGYLLKNKLCEQSQLKTLD
jgi:hypothetical protein